MAKVTALDVIIQNYRTSLTPYLRHENYKHRLIKLACELMHHSVETRDYTHSFDEIFYCYVYLNPLKPGKFRYVLPSGKLICFDCEPYYVGKGKAERLDHHVKEALRSAESNQKLNTIRKIVAAGLVPTRIPTASLVDESMAFAFEIDLIAGIGRRDKKLGPLANLTDGGQGTSGREVSSETKLKQSCIKIKAWQNKSEVEKISASKSAKEAWDNKSEAEKEEFAKAALDRMLNLDDEAKRLRSLKISAGLHAIPNEVKRLMSAKKSDLAYLMHANRSPEEKTKIYNKVSESQKQFHSSLSEEERKVQYAPSVAAKQVSIANKRKSYLRIFFSIIKLQAKYKTQAELIELIPTIPKNTLIALIKEYAATGVLRMKQKGARYPKKYFYKEL